MACSSALRKRGGENESGQRLDRLSARAKQAAPRADAATLGRATAAGAQGLEVQFRTDLSLYDGRFANNAWLQELPRTGTTLT